MLGKNAEKWMKRIANYIQSPEEYDLPIDIFGLPDDEYDDIDKYLKIAEKYWNSIDPKVVKPFDDIELTLPYWMVFVIPRRPSLVYFAVWDKIHRNKNIKVYHDAMLSFQDLIQNYIREELLLFKIVRPFRSILGLSVLPSGESVNEEIESEIKEILKSLSTPQKIIESISEFVDGKTLQLGIAYVLMLEKFSVLVNNAQTNEQLLTRVNKFQNDMKRLRQLDHIIPQQPKLSKTVQIKQKSQKINGNAKKVVEFEKIELQEYDGYVQITGIAENEIRNFRIFDCKEEDLLREEIWRERRYPIRKIVSELLETRYNNSKVKYKLKWGVDINLLEPNWLT